MGFRVGDAGGYDLRCRLPAPLQGFLRPGMAAFLALKRQALCLCSFGAGQKQVSEGSASQAERLARLPFRELARVVEHDDERLLQMAGIDGGEEIGKLEGDDHGRLCPPEQAGLLATLPRSAYKALRPSVLGKPPREPEPPC